MKTTNFCLFFIIVILNFSCEKENIHSIELSESEILFSYLNLPLTPLNYSNPDLPSYFQNQFITIQNNTPNNNPITNWGATLGRVLFYDKDLSINHTISCASCHQQAIGFTDTAQFSQGFRQASTKRHSMSLINAVFYLNGRFFWDERASSLEAQVLQPIQDSIEMGMQLDSVIARLQSKPYYPILFKKAFGTDSILAKNISFALAQFVRSIISFQSKYDKGRNLTSNPIADFPNFSTQENEGKKIFMTNEKVNCSGCHTTDVFILDNARNNGTKIDNPDVGTFIHTQNQQDIGRFKAPTLKNCMQRHRFMHDGNILGIDALIEHYNHGILPNPNLDNHLLDISTNSPSVMNLTPNEVNALKAFLETLTDYEIIKDEKYSNPFK